ncbi:DNA cytosine methyltransferase [Paenibacillus anaericanus]|uniref:DNA (cytosine-5-)-methyltransferase n=1 Tax=Paenibacillus anaericanus TaxID=170367 RepID=A0A3S1DFH4_9BACL|nr:DNA cytosine methyltransferase [Paenibacillus anaericanus]RUT43726.1 DNA cytosine methyltransferase [Paenibacillus anaericanus]
MTYSIVSLFSGAGFLDFGFSENGFDIIRGYELIKEFADANNYNHQLRYGHTDTFISHGDITLVEPKDIPKARGVIGGPPCQDFSIGNANSPGVDGDRGKLVWDFLDKISYLNPDFFLFENVEALYRTKKHRQEALEPMIKKFGEMGYTVYFKVLNTLEYGIPQDRSRVFIVGIKNQIVLSLNSVGLPGFEWPEPSLLKPKTTYNWPDVMDFGAVIDEEEYRGASAVPYELTIHSVIGNTEELSGLPNHVAFRPYSNRFLTVPEGDVKRKSFKRLHRFRYSPTVAYGNNEVHLHPTLPRRLTVREALRLQSVPDWYQFRENTPLGKMFKMVSNGVAFRLAELLAIQIKKVLDEYNEIEMSKNSSTSIVIS